MQKSVLFSFSKLSHFKLKDVLVLRRCFKQDEKEFDEFEMVRDLCTRQQGPPFQGPLSLSVILCFCDTNQIRWSTRRFFDTNTSFST